jgi:manganese/iron transport system permease protein
MEGILAPLLEPFGYSFMVRALVVSVLVGIMCPILGSYVVTRGLGFMGDALAHSVLPGMVVAFIAGVSPFLGAVPAGIAVAVLVGYLSRRAGLSEDTSIGIIFAGLFALGLTLMALARGLPVNVEDILLGQVLGVSNTDVLVTLGLAALVLLVLYAFHKELVFASFDPTGARVIGLPTQLLDYLLLVLLALVIIIALQAVGIVLVIAMLITPAATAYLLVRRFISAMALGAALGAVSAIAGLYISFYLNLPSGPAMTLVATALFIATAALRRRVA